jgi:1-deoxy-D-xylulose-5-phosphate reductoisomerase
LDGQSALPSGVTELKFEQLSQLTFHELDYVRFPLLKIASQVAGHGGYLRLLLLNAANEVAVAAFLNEQIKFTQIHEIVEDVLNRLENRAVENLDMILEADKMAREITIQQLHTI